MRGFTLVATENLVTECCINCGVTFAIPQELQAQLQKNHKDFFCPNGHQQHYGGETEADRLRKQLKEAQRKAEQEKKALEAKNRELWECAADAIDQRDEAKKTLGITRGQLKKLKKRVAASVCPCCNRSFPGDKLHKHIATKHPEFIQVEE